MNHTYLIAYLFVLYWLAISFLNKRGYLEKYNITAWGPVLMVRTTKGQKFLDVLAQPKKFWRAFANIGLPLMFVGMFVMVFIVAIADYAFISQIQGGGLPEPGQFHQPRNILLIPGINDFIPLTWGLIGLVVTLIVHEFSHAILCKVEGIRVKSLGILLAPIPIGAFAEPDEEQLLGKSKDNKPIDKKVATRNERVRILTAGVMANFVTAFFAFALFFIVLGAIEPSGNILITDVDEDSIAIDAGIEPDMIITQLNGVKINSGSDFALGISKADIDSTLSLQVIKDGTTKNITMPVQKNDFDRAGLVIGEVVVDSAAQDAGIVEGTVLQQIDDTRVPSFGDFVGFMNNTQKGQVVLVKTFNRTSDNCEVVNITLGAHPGKSDDNRGFLGVSQHTGGGIFFGGITISEFPAKEYLHALRSIPSMLNGLTGWFIIFTLPIFGFGGEGFPGFGDLLINFYEPAGWAQPLGIWTFWIANSALWIGWINFYVGLFNCLPAVPLDGGHVFKDTLSSVFNKILKNEKRSEQISHRIITVLAVMIFSSFFLIIALPWIFQL
ncbi:MAG: hypothetical protein SRB1_01264 [Desulfobacteraceae bacterium Eth-SRB1]|nr:MAG: hypothetical protein SRB1_01264 [Desulfobacteraceae bacterium Eth-SRB1]